MNRWNIPDWLERKIVERDTKCVYCGIVFAHSERRLKPSWEHIINDTSIITIRNVALCCVGCNASKGTKDLAQWLQSEYCKARGITKKSVAAVIRSALKSGAHYEWPRKVA